MRTPRLPHLRDLMSAGVPVPFLLGSALVFPVVLLIGLLASRWLADSPVIDPDDRA